MSRTGVPSETFQNIGSLSRIWGGIHPPVDDIPGRLMGIEIGEDAFELAKEYFEGNSIVTSFNQNQLDEIRMYPNPVTDNILTVSVPRMDGAVSMEILERIYGDTTASLETLQNL